MATTALLASQDLLTAIADRPSSILGVYVTSFLSGRAQQTTRSALDGIAAQLSLYFGQQADTQSAAAVLEQLGTTLQVNIPDMLNRSANRVKALDEYLAFLATATEEATAQHDNLEVRSKELQKQISAKRSEVSALKREVSQAVSKKNFAVAGEKQELAGIAEKALSELDLERKQIQSTIDLIEELLTIAEERELAITQNRDALIAGLTVVDVPGATDLGVLRKGVKR